MSLIFIVYCYHCWRWINCDIKLSS